MAIQYVITEAEMNSLFDQLRLERLRDENICRTEANRTPEEIRDSFWRGFHMVTVRWSQSVGFKGGRF